VIFTRPSADRMDQFLTCSQFLIEGSQTMVLFLGSVLAGYGNFAAQDNCMAAGFWFGLLALFLPIAEKVYDALINPISQCCAGEFDPQGTAMACFSLALALPSFFMSLFGMSSDAVDNITGSIDEISGVIDEAIADGVITADYVAEIASDLRWMHSSKKHHKAAVTLQKNWRGLQDRGSVEKGHGIHRNHREADRIITRARANLETQRKEASAHRCATKLQAQYRSRKTRKELEFKYSDDPAKLATLKKLMDLMEGKQEARLAEIAEGRKKRQVLIRQKTQSKLQRQATQTGQSLADLMKAAGLDAEADEPTSNKANTMNWLEKAVAEVEGSEAAEVEHYKIDIGPPVVAKPQRRAISFKRATSFKRILSRQPSVDETRPAELHDGVIEGLGIIYTQHSFGGRAATPSVRSARQTPGTSVRDSAKASRAKTAMTSLPEKLPPALLGPLRMERSRNGERRRSPNRVPGVARDAGTLATLEPASPAIAAKLQRAAQARAKANRRIIGGVPAVPPPLDQPLAPRQYRAGVPTYTHAMSTCDDSYYGGGSSYYGGAGSSYSAVAGSRYAGVASSVGSAYSSVTYARNNPSWPLESRPGESARTAAIENQVREAPPFPDMSRRQGRRRRGEGEGSGSGRPPASREPSAELGI